MEILVGANQNEFNLKDEIYLYLHKYYVIYGFSQYYLNTLVVPLKFDFGDFNQFFFIKYVL